MALSIISGIFAFLTGVSIIVLIAYINKNRRNNAPLINHDVILSFLLTIVLTLLTLEQYLFGIIVFVISALTTVYFVKNSKTQLFELENMVSAPENNPPEIKEKHEKEIEQKMEMGNNRPEKKKRKEIKKKAKKR